MADRPRTAHEVARSYDVEVLKASFPSKQAVARPASFELEVKNTGSRAVPDVAVTVDSFNYKSNYPGLADNRRPIWAIEQGPGVDAKPPVESEEVSQPGGGQTAYLNTWALGALPAGTDADLRVEGDPRQAGSPHRHLRRQRRAGRQGQSAARRAVARRQAS